MKKKWLVKNFLGFLNDFEEQDLVDGVVVDGLNWIFSRDKIKNKGVGKIELRRGYVRLGQDNGIGKIRGLRKMILSNGDELLIRVRDRKIEYYDNKTKNFVESGNDILPINSINDDFSIEPYYSLAGESIYLSSKNSSIYKIMARNPQDVIDMQLNNFRGYIKIRNNAMFLWQRNGQNTKDETGVYRSKMDRGSYSEYNYITNELIGVGGNVNYSGILAFKSGGSKRTCFGVYFFSGNLKLFDNYDGTLSGDGFGTINYATGAYNITFNQNTPGNVYVNYYWEDSSDGGICDFSPPSNPRIAKESFIIRQDDGGGKIQNIAQYQGNYYCFHEKKSWKLNISADDTQASNLTFLENIGIPNFRAMVETSDGIYYIDNFIDKDGNFDIKLLSLNLLSQNVIPTKISNGVNFKNYLFDKAVLIEWGNYIILACREKTSEFNNVLFLYDKKIGLWNPPHNISARCLEVFEGNLISGSDFLKNTYKLYSGFLDDDALIDNYVIFNITNCGFDGIKKIKKFFLEGYIQKGQILEVYASYDRGNYELIDVIDYSNITGGGGILLGEKLVGTEMIGGEDSESVNVFYFRKESKINSKEFKEIQIKFVAKNIGYVAITSFGISDLRLKSLDEVEKYKN